MASLVVTSCSDVGEPDPKDSGVEGVALIGPTCPVERDPPDPDCADRPLAHATIRAQRAADVVGNTKTDAQGRFRLPLEPGSYQLYTSGGIQPFGTPVATVRVVSNRFTRVELRIDSGIR
jgi:hypothetical protein